MTARALFVDFASALPAVTAAEVAVVSSPVAFVIFEFSAQTPPDDVEHVWRQWRLMTQGTPLETVPAMVMQAGVRMTLLDASGRQMSQVGTL